VSPEPSPAPAREPAAPAGFWQRRVRAPLLALLTQGATPEKLASGIGWAVLCSLFPFLGTTTALNTAVAAWRRLNQPLLHAINIALGPVHLVMILVYVRLGETLWGATGEARFSITEMLQAFADLSLGEFFQRFGLAGVHAFTAWALTAPLLYWASYYTALPALRRLTRLLPARGGIGASAPPASP
jgi:uncharacterized protein (DUF2062 family)